MLSDRDDDVKESVRKLIKKIVGIMTTALDEGRLFDFRVVEEKVSSLPVSRAGHYKVVHDRSFGTSDAGSKEWTIRFIVAPRREQ